MPDFNVIQYLMTINQHYDSIEVIFRFLVSIILQKARKVKNKIIQSRQTQ